MTTTTRPDTVDFHFDVLCPWAYQTSLWMREVRDHLDLTVRWRWYAVTGRALHVDGMKIHEPDVARLLIEEIGLDPGLVDEAIDDESTHEEVRADHDKVIAAGGFGVPTLFFPGVDGGPEQTIFGPVLLDPPTGEPALRLWDVVCGWLEFPHLYELQRPKTKEDERLIGCTFKPYMEARDWVSINRGKVVAMEEDGFNVKGDAKDAGKLKG
jgi:hypothetical protein